MQYELSLNGGHPTAPLYAAMANMMEELISKAVKDHIEYFQDYIGLK